MSPKVCDVHVLDIFDRNAQAQGFEVNCLLIQYETQDFW